ncbi:MAG: DUF5104 domain-containing protein [Clostridiales bacterium]|nr:DUF5104 domain-containing protein [Clostridiales bacterium]
MKGDLMTRYGKQIVVAIIAVMVLLTGCSLSDLVPDAGSRPFSKIDKPYKDKKDIDNKSENVYMRTAAGTLEYIAAGDKAGLKKMLCKGLLDMKDTEDAVDDLLEGFKGDIKDTTYISADLGARKTAQWSKTEAVAVYESEFYVYTDKETYYLGLDVCAVNDRDSDGKDSVGVTRLHLMTLDKRYGLKLESGFKDDGPSEYTDRYTFGDGSGKDVECVIVGVSQCSIMSEFGRSDGFQVLNTGKVWSDNDVWKITGTSDSISKEDLKDLDYSDEKEVREFFNSYEQYALTEDDAHCRLYNLAGSDKKIHVYSDNYDDGDDGYKVKYVQIIDLSELYDKQNRESIYNYKDKK